MVSLWGATQISIVPLSKTAASVPIHSVPSTLMRPEQHGRTNSASASRQSSSSYQDAEPRRSKRFDTPAAPRLPAPCALVHSHLRLRSSASRRPLSVSYLLLESWPNFPCRFGLYFHTPPQRFTADMRRVTGDCDATHRYWESDQTD